MLFIVNKNINDEALRTLRKEGKTVTFYHDNFPYDYLAGHVDLFITGYNKTIVAAPDTPEYLIKTLQENGCKIIKGTNRAVSHFPQCASYNAAVSENLFIHNTRYSDPVLLEQTADKKIISVNQGMTRCSTVIIDEKSVITSDRGIYTAVINNGLDALYTSPDDIILEGQKYGLFGGCCGIFKKTLYINGNLSLKTDGSKIKTFAESRGIKIVELADTPLTDVGSIFITG